MMVKNEAGEAVAHIKIKVVGKLYSFQVMLCLCSVSICWTIPNHIFETEILFRYGTDIFLIQQIQYMHCLILYSYSLSVKG